MRIEELKPVKGATRKVKRVGRGPGSGAGKTASKGHKGQKARSGGVKGAGFEGGQMPLQRRIPKRGFTNIFRKEYAVVNLADLGKVGNADTVTPELLMKSGLIKDLKSGVKILGMGELKAKLIVKAHKFSKNAAEKIEAAGGKAEVI